jgi:hypothetical protein
MGGALLREEFFRDVDGSTNRPGAAWACPRFADGGCARAQTIVAAWIPRLSRVRVL